MSKTRKPKTVADIEAKAGRTDVLRNPDGSNSRSDQHIDTLTKRHGKAELNRQLQGDLYQRISKVLAEYPDLLWMGSSEEDQPITAYQAHVSQLAGWETTGDIRTAIEVVRAWSFSGWDTPELLNAAIDLRELLLDNKFPCLLYKRPTPDEDSTFDLVIGVIEGETITGISTKTVET